MCIIVIAQSKAVTQPESARRMGILSIVFSGIGVAVGIIAIIVIVVIMHQSDVRHFVFPYNFSQQFSTSLNATACQILCTAV